MISVVCLFWTLKIQLKFFNDFHFSQVLLTVIKINQMLWPLPHYYNYCFIPCIKVLTKLPVMSKWTKAFLLNKLVLSSIGPRNIASFICNKHQRRKSKLLSAEQKKKCKLYSLIVHHGGLNFSQGSVYVWFFCAYSMHPKVSQDAYRMWNKS